MGPLTLTKVGAICAVLTTAVFVVGIVFMASSGVQVLIPDTGETLDWIADVDAANGLFFAGAWLVIAGGLLGVVALVGFWEALKEVGPWLVLAPILGAVSLTLVTISHLVPIAMAYELVPGYVDADAAARAAIAVDADTLTSLSHALNYAGDLIAWGVVTPMFAVAVLRTRIVGRWIGWVGMVAAAVGGWLGAFSPASSVIDGITFLGFVAFFVFLAAMGVSLLRRERRAGPEGAPATAVP
jgi:hypothetical protein